MKKTLRVTAKRFDIDIDDLIEYDKNNKTHWDKQIDWIANSINRFSYYDEIIVDKNNIIIAGHWRLEAIKKLWYEAVEVKQLNIDSKEAGAMRILDNILSNFEVEDNLENIVFDLNSWIDLTLWEFGQNDFFPELDAPDYNPDDYLNNLLEDTEDWSLSVAFKLPNPENIWDVKELLKQFDVIEVKY